MAALSPRDAAAVLASAIPPPKKAANLLDPFSLKRVLDDTTSEVPPPFPLITLVVNVPFLLVPRLWIGAACWIPVKFPPL